MLFALMAHGATNQSLWGILLAKRKIKTLMTNNIILNYSIYKYINQVISIRGYSNPMILQIIRRASSSKKDSTHGKIQKLRNKIKNLRSKIRNKPNKRKADNIRRSLDAFKAVNKNSLILVPPITFEIILDRLCEPIGLKTGPMIKEISTFHDNLIKNHSVVEGTARFNSIRLYAIMMLEGRSPEPLSRVAVGNKDR
jgi:hypothetical protein